MTKAGRRCRNAALPGSERCRLHASVPDPAVVEHLMTMLRSGAYVNPALVATGVRPDRTLAEQLEKAAAEGETRNVLLIANAARGGNWAAAAWLLERMYPERWGRVLRATLETPAEPASSADSLDELANRRDVRRRRA